MAVKCLEKVIDAFFSDEVIQVLPSTYISMSVEQRETLAMMGYELWDLSGTLTPVNDPSIYFIRTRRNSL